MVLKFAIIGSRKFGNLEKIEEVIEDQIFPLVKLGHDVMVFSGGASGVDTYAKLYCDNLKIPFTVFEAEWNKWGKGAGFRRNLKIILNSDIVFAFWNGDSKGTAHSIKLAYKHQKELMIFSELIKDEH